MMRLIDANKLSQIICENVPAPYEDSREAKEECLRIIEEALTIDAVPVVRCKGCKYGVPLEGGVIACKRLKGVLDGEVCTVIVGKKGDDFCSYGERGEKG